MITEKAIAQDRIIGALTGLACGDAVGTTLEFKPRGSFIPISDMVGGGPFNLKKGEWTDDTSMALCLGYSLLEMNGFDATDQMDRYLRWCYEGYMSSNGYCFDIGKTVSEALHQYRTTNEPFAGSTHESSSGNGSIMRLAPVAIYWSHNLVECIEFAGRSSRTTHASEQCIDACKLFAELIVRAFSALEKDSIFHALEERDYCRQLQPILDRSLLQRSYDELNGSGYVIDSLMAALWCFYHSESFEEAILLAANLGNDADTTAAVCGQIAGAFYGYNGIPEKWRNALVMENEIKALALGLYNESN